MGVGLRLGIERADLMAVRGEELQTMNDQNMVTQAVPDRDQESQQLSACVEMALDFARQAGVDAAEASASAQSGLGVNVRLGEIETLEHHRDRGVAVTVYLKQSKGHASSADLRPESIRQCVERAVDIARFTQPDRANGLADPDRLATEFPDLDLWHPEPLTVDGAIERALRCEEAGRQDSRISNSEGAAVNTQGSGQ